VGIRIFQAAPTKLSRDALTPFNVLLVDFLNSRTAGSNSYHKIALCLDFFD
jgi:hypothetical protein